MHGLSSREQCERQMEEKIIVDEGGKVAETIEVAGRGPKPGEDSVHKCPEQQKKGPGSFIMLYVFKLT